MAAFMLRPLSAFEQAGGQAKAPAQEALAGAHFAVVGFVVHACQVQEGVQEQDAELGVEVMATGAGLAGGGLDGNGNIAGVAGGGRGE